MNQGDDAAASAMIAKPYEPLKSNDLRRIAFANFYTTTASGKMIGSYATKGAAARYWNWWGRVNTSARNNVAGYRRVRVSNTHDTNSAIS